MSYGKEIISDTGDRSVRNMTVGELREFLANKSLDDDMNVWLISNAGAPEKTEPDFIVSGGYWDERICVVIMPGQEAK